MRVRFAMAVLCPASRLGLQDHRIRRVARPVGNGVNVLDLIYVAGTVMVFILIDLLGKAVDRL